ncbi:hypothetical protein, partial [Pseudorhodobacter sp.]|uniref:hypothetical protein n=1 Tax=Pseudorhodobacter sp. TaxID=1934400 RepID=UPI0026473DFF
MWTAVRSSSTSAVAAEINIFQHINSAFVSPYAEPFMDMSFVYAAPTVRAELPSKALDFDNALQQRLYPTE